MSDGMPPMPQPSTALVAQSGDIKVHSFVSPDMFLANATYVIEGPESVVVVDGQFVSPVAYGFRAFAESFGKPIARVYLTHDHVDHWFGLSSAFGDLPVYALQETIDSIATTGEELRAARAAVYGDFVPAAVVVPGNEAVAGATTVDGIELQIIKVDDAEVEHQLMIGLPQVNALIVGDLVYSGNHVYVTPDTSGWQRALADLAASDWSVFLPGHGPAADAAELLANAEYLQRAGEIFAASADADAFKEAILAAYPDRGGAALVDIYGPRLYGQEG